MEQWVFLCAHFCPLFGHVQRGLTSQPNTPQNSVFINCISSVRLMFRLFMDSPLELFALLMPSTKTLFFQHKDGAGRECYQFLSVKFSINAVVGHWVMYTGLGLSSLGRLHFKREKRLYFMAVFSVKQIWVFQNLLMKIWEVRELYLDIRCNLSDTAEDLLGHSSPFWVCGWYYMYMNSVSLPLSSNHDKEMICRGIWG